MYVPGDGQACTSVLMVMDVLMDESAAALVLCVASGLDEHHHQYESCSPYLASLHTKSTALTVEPHNCF